MSSKNILIEGEVEALGNYKTIQEKIFHANVDIIDKRTNELVQFKNFYTYGTMSGYLNKGASGKFFIRKIEDGVNVLIGMETERGYKIHAMEDIKKEKEQANKLEGAGKIDAFFCIALVAATLAFPQIALFTGIFVLFGAGASFYNFQKAKKIKEAFDDEAIKEFLNENGYNIEI